MSIENIQKTRFLNTIFKMYYALGGEPNYNDLSILFGQFFSINKPGEPVKITYDDLNISNKIDLNVLNKLMVTLLYNADVLYDSFSEEVESLYSIVSSYKFRLDSLREKRSFVESKIDDYLFSIKNTDGYYYSVSNNFSSYDGVDRYLSSAYVDLDSRKVCINKVNTSNTNYKANILKNAQNVTVEMFFEGELRSKFDSVDMSVLFSGLNNAFWNYIGQDGSIGFKTEKIGACTLKISIPLSSGQINTVSLIEGRDKIEKTSRNFSNSY